MSRRFAGFAAVSLVVGASASARAAEGDADEVVVRGAPSSVTGFVSRGSEADATREITDVASLLEPLPGIHVQRLGSSDSFSTLSIRGSSSSEVAVLFAGVPLTGGADPTLDLGSLPLWPGARVRVYRSFTPAAVDRGSLGGTLVLEPPRPTDAEGTTAWAGVGSFGDARLRLADVRALMDGRARIVTALSASRADDDFPYYDAVHSTPANSVYTTRQNAQHAAINGFTALALPLDLGGGEPGTVTISALAQSRLQHLPGPATTPTLFATLSTNRELLSVDVAKPVTDTGAIHLLGWSRRDELSSYDRQGSSLQAYDDRELSTDDVILGSGGAVSYRGQLARRLSVEARVDGSFERFAPGHDVSAFGVDPGATRGSAGGGVDVDWSPVARWRLGGSGRVDATVDTSDPSAAIASGITPQGTDVRPTGHLGTEVAIGPVTLAAHGGALARPPSFLERYGGGGILPNPSLVPESALTADAGARYVAKARRWRAQLEVDGFATRATDLITLIPEGALGLTKAFNIASARLFGVEASADVRGYGLDVRASYTGLLTKNDDPSLALQSSETRPPLPGRPAHDFVGDVAYTLGPVRLRYGVDVVAGLYADREGSVLVPDRVLQSAGLRVLVPHVDELHVALDLNNLFDVRTGLSPGFGGPTREPIGDQFDYPLPGRSFLVTARWSPGAPKEPDGRRTP